MSIYLIELSNKDKHGLIETYSLIGAGRGVLYLLSLGLIAGIFKHRRSAIRIALVIEALTLLGSGMYLFMQRERLFRKRGREVRISLWRDLWDLGFKWIFSGSSAIKLGGVAMATISVFFDYNKSSVARVAGFLGILYMSVSCALDGFTLQLLEEGIARQQEFRNEDRVKPIDGEHYTLMKHYSLVGTSRVALDLFILCIVAGALNHSRQGVEAVLLIEAVFFVGLGIYLCVKRSQMGASGDNGGSEKWEEWKELWNAGFKWLFTASTASKLIGAAVSAISLTGNYHKDTWSRAVGFSGVTFFSIASAIDVFSFRLLRGTLENLQNSTARTEQRYSQPAEKILISPRDPRVWRSKSTKKQLQEYREEQKRKLIGESEPNDYSDSYEFFQ